MLDMFIARTGLTRHHVDQIVQEYRRFIELAKNHKVSPSHAVDEFWHFHILNTRDYIDFCDRYVGRYLHHTPSTSPMKDQYCETLQLYYDVFSETPPPSIWPVPKNFTLRRKTNDTKNNSDNPINSDGDSGFWGWLFDTSDSNDDNSSSFWGGLFGGGGAGGDWGDSGDGGGCSSCSSCSSCGGD